MLPLVWTGFTEPFNLGGLFYLMSLEVLQNQYRLPARIPFFTPGGLPFAYPPLPFYLQAAVIQLFHPPLFVSVNLLPPLLAVISLAAFYGPARLAFRSTAAALGALFVFALLPAAFSEQIEAQGLSESLGTLAMIGLCAALCWARDRWSVRDALLPGVALALAMLSSPGSLYAAGLVGLLFAGVRAVQAVQHKTILPVLNALAVGALGLLLSSPYWAAVLAQHGVDVYLTPFRAQNGNTLRSLYYSIREFDLFPGGLVWQLLFYASALIALLRRQFVLLLFAGLLFLVPRETWLLSLPVSLLIGFSMASAAVWLHARVQPTRLAWAAAGMVGFLLLAWALLDARGALNTLMADPRYDLPAAQVKDLALIQADKMIPPDGEVAVIGQWGLIEWTPALIERTVIDNHFGLEWLPEQSKKAKTLGDSLRQAKNAGEALARIRQYDPRLDRVYLIGSKEKLRSLAKRIPGQNADLRILDEYDVLALGLLTHAETGKTLHAAAQPARIDSPELGAARSGSR